MNKLILSFAILLTSQLSISQNVYPRLVSINGDSVVALTIEQVKKINKTFVDLDAERLTSNTLYSEIDLLNSYLDVKDRKIKNLTEQTVVQDSILTEYEIQKEAIESDLRKTQRKLKLTKVTRFLGFGGGVAIGAYAMYLINRFVTINI